MFKHVLLGDGPKRVTRCSPALGSFVFLLGILCVNGCSKSTQPNAAVPVPAAASQSAPAANPVPAQMQLPDVALSADGLDELLSPVALYPDPVIAVMLQASQDPQEVMDGGNFLAMDQNQGLRDADLDKAASKAGFTPVIQALLHYGPVVDLMCTQFDWTKQLGAAYKADPKAVLASVQRLRAQAVDNGALKSSPQMKVDVTQDQGAQVVEISSPNPGAVYIPQYEPSQVYAPPPPAAPPVVVAPAAPGQTVVVQQDSGVSKGTAAMIGLLSFGAGIAVGSAIHHDDYYSPNWGYGGVYYGGRPYYPPPYRPVYGPGWHGGGCSYNRPVHYSSNNIYINNSQNNYYNRFNGNNNTRPGYRPQPVRYNNRPGSITAGSLGNRADARRGITATNRPANANNGFRGQTTYQGANRAANPAQQNRMAAASAAGNNIQRPGDRSANGFKSQGPGQQGNRPTNLGQANRPTQLTAGNNAPSRLAAGNSGNARPNSAMAAPRPASVSAGTGRGAGYNNRPMAAGNTNRAGVDRGFGQGNAAAARPASATINSRPAAGNRAATPSGGAFGGAANAKSDRAASARGRQSMGGISGGQRGNTGGGRRGRS